MTSQTEVPAAENPSDTERASWNWGLDRMRPAIAHYPQDSQDALIALFRWCTDPRHLMRRNDAAARLGCSGNLLYQLCMGIYRNPDKTLRPPSDDLIKRIREFLKLEAERYEAGQTEFVLTPTARKLCTAFDLARESQSIVFVWGPSHIGKTWTAELHYTPGTNHGRTVYTRMRAASGLGGMVRRIADSCGISDNANTADLIDRIKRGLSPNMLLIVDECHLLAHTYRKGSFHNCMEVLREIHDETKCGMVLIFTILDEVKAASQKELQQLWRRGVHKVPLPMMPTKGDLACILEHCGLEFPARDLTVIVGKSQVVETPYEVIRQLAKSEGLKAITERIRYARKLASKENARKLTWSHFVDAHLRIEKQAQQEGEWS